MGLILIGGVLALGFYFVSRQKVDTQIALSGNAPNDTRILGSNDIGLSPPTQPSTVRPGPSIVTPPAQILGLLQPIPPESSFTTVPEPPTNTVQISPVFLKALTNLLPPPTPSVAPVSPSIFGMLAKKNPPITNLKPLGFSPPKATQPTPMNVPKSGGLNSTLVKSPPLPASLATKAVTLGKLRF